MEGFGGSDILKLAELLKPVDEQDDFDDEQRVRSTKSKKGDEIKPKIIRTEDEETKVETRFENTELQDTTSDWRKCPEWNLIYKQAVTPSDVYLQMSGKTQLTSSCEEMVITVQLPGESSGSIDLKVTKTNLDLLSMNFRLSTPLPHPVDPQKGTAKWDASKEALVISLVMDREFDFVNF